ncbi:hypothetical protein PIB30_032242 [Stylosanthes scabra]|uniref:TIR domain-containing protein n=1 Tax=Stylosanthes scabra TaxID=79078 RepID=A0ABU6VDE1_9FABA|nr:hypothetical protein [Stylosanthes scabra]
MANSSLDQGATPSSHFMYDVFLSFRGYTRLGFTDALYHALINKRIVAFRDSEKLRIGEELEGSLLEAIERSRMSILILCDRYPTSRCCLDELVKIMECSDNGRKRPVLPIYYYVERSDVQYRINEYGIAMAAHKGKGRYNHKLEAWRSALSEVGKIYGQRCDQNTPWGTAIDNIVEEVSKRLPPELLHIDHPLEFDSELEDVKLRLEIDSHSTCFILGIHGDAASFLSNVSEKTNASGGGLEELQKTLLSEMGEEVKTKIGSTFKGSSEIRRRLGQKRVLLVLDDVDSIQQLNSLAGGIDWFGPGSRIIITTRNEDLLDEQVLNNGFEIKRYCIVGKQVEEDDLDKGDVVGFTNNFSFVYDNNEVKNLFPCRGWSCVSKDYETREVLLSLLQSLKLSTSMYQNSTVEHLKKTVRNFLKGKKYLIMLDDIWEPEVWDDLKTSFPNESNGSKILITSRNEEVANYTNSRPYKLPLLDEKESWELFCKKVFFDEECPSDLEPLGRSIIESCGGLPLAIVAIAGVIARKKRSEREWLGVKECIHWHLTKDMTKVMDVLKLSYDSLSEELKPCFLYLGIYPQDFEIWTRELIQLWMAEGFIQARESGIPNAPEPEVVGEEYLKELVDRNMVHVSRQRSDGGVKKCLIHDLFRDLCIILSKAEKFFEVFTGSNIHTIRNPQRLSLLCKENSYMSSVETNQSSARSLFFFAGDNCSNDALENFQSVQVLYLGGQACFQRIPCNLEAMIFLKYLKIGKTRHLRTVPLCIWSLPNLETLDVRGWMTFCIPNKFWKLKQLRHVYIFSNGVRLPKDEEGQDSRTRTTMLNLQSLCSVDFDTPISFLFCNGRFPNLRKLGLWLDPRRENRCSWHELLLSLRHLSNLHTLKLRCCHSDFSMDQIMFPLNLAKITFTVFGKLDSSSMKALGQLPNLQVLKLLEGTIPEPLDCATGDFPKLQFLKMLKVEVQHWILKKGAMPHLRILVIWSCSELSELPEQLWSLTTLAEVHVINPSNELENSLQDVEVNDNCDLTISYAEKH